MRLAPSPAAQFQATKTRALLGVQLFFQAVLTLLCAWMLLTTLVVWHDTGLYLPQLHHAYFVQWIACSLLGWSRWIHIPLDGAFVTVQAASEWLNGPQVYHHSFSQAFRHVVTGTAWGLVVDLLPVSFVAILIAWRWRQDPNGSDHLRGLRLVTARRLTRELHGPLMQRWLYGPPRGIRLGNITIPEAYICEHLVAMGNTGAGKSTGVYSLLEQIQQRPEDCAVVIDPDRQMTEAFYNETRGDIILNPLDARCPYWNLHSELRPDWFAVDAAALAASLIRGLPRADNERFFLTSTRTVIEAILHLTRDQGEVEDLLGFVAQDRTTIHKALKGTPAYQLIDPEAHDQGAGILGTASNAIKTFVHLPTRDEAARTWSAREWAEHRQGWIFLPSRQDFHAAIELLQGLWLDCIVRWLMSAETANANMHRTWLICDELASLGYQPNIETVLTRGRKRELPTLLAFQNISQLKRHYGEENSTTLISSAVSKLFMRMDEPRTGKWISDMIGHHEIERLTMTQLAGRSTFREGINLQPHRSVEPLVLPDEVALLRKFEGYLCIAGHNRTKVKIPRRFPTATQPGFIQRTKAQGLEQVTTLTDDEILERMKAQPAPAIGG
jgi:Type IV secretion-system coupling protein DNA-binding domain